MERLNRAYAEVREAWEAARAHASARWNTRASPMGAEGYAVEHDRLARRLKAARRRVWEIEAERERSGKGQSDASAR